MRQLHLWVGAWGAIAAILYGLTGLVMNHRFGDAAWPQGDSREVGRTSLMVPAPARASPEALSTWLREKHGLDAQVIRKPGPDAKGPPKWTLGGGTARASWSVEYAPGDTAASLKRSEHTVLAALNRLHKAVGGGGAWVWLADSFALAMILLGISGVWMWARGRTPRTLVLSVFGGSLAVLVLVLGPALA
jgi:hypothetical protein